MKIGREHATAEMVNSLTRHYVLEKGRIPCLRAVIIIIIIIITKSSLITVTLLLRHG